MNASYVIPEPPDGAEWVRRGKCYGLRCIRTGDVCTYNMTLPSPPRDAWEPISVSEIPDRFARFAAGAVRQWHRRVR